MVILYVAKIIQNILTELIYAKRFVLEALLENYWLFFVSNSFLNFAIDSAGPFNTKKVYYWVGISNLFGSYPHCQIDCNELQVAERMLVK